VLTIDLDNAQVQDTLKRAKEAANTANIVATGANLNVL
jgi:hypothetical protein